MEVYQSSSEPVGGFQNFLNWQHSEHLSPKIYEYWDISQQARTGNVVHPPQGQDAVNQ